MEILTKRRHWGQYAYRIHVRLDGPAWREIQKYTEGEGISIAEAVRRLCREAGPRPIAGGVTPQPVANVPRPRLTQGFKENRVGRFFMESHHIFVPMDQATWSCLAAYMARCDLSASAAVRMICLQANGRRVPSNPSFARRGGAG